MHYNNFCSNTRLYNEVFVITITGPSTGCLAKLGEYTNFLKFSKYSFFSILTRN